MEQEGEALHQFVLSWADDKYVFGHQLASITGYYGPDLEENLALGSLAQDHLGHARMLYQQMASTDQEIDRLVFLRPPNAYRCSLLASAWQDRNWAFLVVKGFLYAYAELSRAEAIAEAGRGPWCDLAQVVVRDESVHLDHWRQWAFALSQRPEGVVRLQTALDQLWPLGGEFFYEPLWKGVEVIGEISQARALLFKWVSQAGSELHSLGFSTALATVQELSIQAEVLAQQGLCGRLGQHPDVFHTLLNDAHAIYQSDPTVIWG